MLSNTSSQASHTDLVHESDYEGIPTPPSSPAEDHPQVKLQQDIQNVIATYQSRLEPEKQRQADALQQAIDDRADVMFEIDDLRDRCEELELKVQRLEDEKQQLVMALADIRSLVGADDLTDLLPGLSATPRFPSRRPWDDSTRDSTPPGSAGPYRPSYLISSPIWLDSDIRTVVSQPSTDEGSGSKPKDRTCTKKGESPTPMELDAEQRRRIIRSVEAVLG